MFIACCEPTDNSIIILETLCFLITMPATFNLGKDGKFQFMRRVNRGMQIRRSMPFFFSPNPSIAHLTCVRDRFSLTPMYKIYDVPKLKDGKFHFMIFYRPKCFSGQCTSRKFIGNYNRDRLEFSISSLCYNEVTHSPL